MQLEPHVLRLIDIGRLRVDFLTGEIYSTASNAPGRPLGAITTNGYLRVCVSVAGQQAHALAHRIVWCAANGAVPDGMQIDHINGDKTDNRLVNLSLVDQPENMRRAVDLGLMRPVKQTAHHAAKLTDADVEAIRALHASGVTGATIGRQFGISQSHARRVAKGERWTMTKQERPNG